MLLDIMSSYNHISVNTKAIKLFGLPTAAYFAVLTEIYPRVISKKLDEMLHDNGYFTVDRNYIESRCGLSVEDQYACDKGLERIGVLHASPDHPDMLMISLDTMFVYLAEDDAKVLEQIRKKAKTKKSDEAAGKRQGMASMLSAYAATLTHVPEVQEAFRLWITAMVDSGKAKMSKAVVQLFYETISNYTKDAQTQVNLLRAATASGYTNAEWVINSASGSRVATKSTPATASRTGVTQKQFSGISSESF